MKDNQIVNLYWTRDEQAILETQRKYGHYCYAIASNILGNHEDAEECVNDTYNELWNAIPPHRPAELSTFIGKIARRLSCKKYRYNSAQKRGGGEMILALEELEECIPGDQTIESIMESKELTALMNEFLATLRADDRIIFVRRYWYIDSCKEIALKLEFSESKVKMSLKRTREKLNKVLRKEGVAI